MFKRKILREMKEWKDSLKIKKKGLIIKGLRQIGKTTIVDYFCKQNYDNVIYINFKEEESIKKVFDGDLNVDDLIMKISAIKIGSKFIPSKTVIIFDELQECANARASIKTFSLDGRFDIIGTGSLLGLRGYNKKGTKGVPTGFERIITMKAMDFEEFLWAKGIDKKVLSYIEECFYNKTKIDETINNKMNDYFNEYLCVGGMPEVVNTFFKTHDMNQVLKVQREILEEYKDDFGKHLNDEEKEIIDKVELARIMQVYNSIPNQLAKENKKFQYSVVSKNAKAREYSYAVEWLKDFGLIDICYNLKLLDKPLNGNINPDCFKIYVQDTGLFIAMLEDGSVANILNNELGIYKGAVYENIIADAFIKNNKALYYYKKDDVLEIDFVANINSEIALIEVKSNKGKATSLRAILENNNYNISKNYKLARQNIGNDGLVYTYPLYVAYLL